MKCPKCGSGFLSKNDDGDLECICGKIIYDIKQLQISTDAADRKNVANMSRSQSVKYYKVSEKKPNEAPCIKNEAKNLRGAHYSKVAEKQPIVTKAVEKGIGIRQAAREFGLAVNTVRGIVREDNKASQSQKTRREREKEHHWLQFALKGLAVHSNRYTPEEIWERAIALLEKYMQGNPKRTVFELLPEVSKGATFTVDDLLRALAEMLTREVLNYDKDTWEYIGDDTYRLKDRVIETNETSSL